MEVFDRDKPDLDDGLLAHFGVKGMRWGVRKKKDPQDQVSKADKKLARKNEQAAWEAIGEIRVKEMFEPRAISKKSYESLSRDDVLVKKGEEFARVTFRKDEQLRDKTFVSRDAGDRVTYRAVMPAMSVRKKDAYEYIYTATKDLHGPSDRARVDAFIDLMDTPSVKVGRKTMTGREYLKKQGFGRDVKRLETQELGLKYYNQVISRGVMAKKEPLSSAYFQSLSAKGYSVVGDDNDRGILTKDPLIVLNPNGSIKKMSVKRLTQREINEAQKTFKVAYPGKEG